MNINDLIRGQRVILAANDEEGFEEERGVLLDIHYPSNTVVVEVDDQYRDGRFDDGIRECTADQVQEIIE